MSEIKSTVAEIEKVKKAIIVNECLHTDLDYNPAIRGNLPPRGPPIPEQDFQEGAQKLAELIADTG